MLKVNDDGCHEGISNNQEANKEKTAV